MEQFGFVSVLIETGMKFTRFNPDPIALARRSRGTRKIRRNSHGRTRRLRGLRFLEKLSQTVKDKGDENNQSEELDI